MGIRYPKFFKFQVYSVLHFLSFKLHIPKRTKLDRFMQFKNLKNTVQLKEYSPSRKKKRCKRGVKRGRPKSERKQIDAELFKRLKADPSEEIQLHDFQQVKFANFKKGSLA